MLLTTADGIAVLGICGVIVSAIIKYAPKRLNGNYVQKETCDARVAGMSNELKLIHNELRDLNKYVRGTKE